MQGAKILCASSLPLASKAVWRNIRWPFMAIHQKHGTHVKVLPTHPATVQIQLQSQNGDCTEAANIEKMKIFIEKAGRDKGIYANAPHDHNDRH